MGENNIHSKICFECLLRYSLVIFFFLISVPHHSTKIFYAKDTNNCYVCIYKGRFSVFLWNLTSHQHLTELIIPSFIKHSSINIHDIMHFLFLFYFLNNIISFSKESLKLTQRISRATSDSLSSNSVASVISYFLLL